jgi:hypothetical protein
VDSNGIVDPASFVRPARILLSVMNASGEVVPLSRSEIAASCPRTAGFHTDAVRVGNIRQYKKLCMR